MAGEKILQGSNDLEKGAYLGAIASIATADRTASPEEIEYLTQLAEAADLSQDQKQAVVRAATELQGTELARCLDVLKNSELKYSLVADLMAFAKSDGDYNELEEQSVQKIAQHLGVDQKQFSLLDEFAEKATNTESPQQVQDPGFLSSLGLNDKLKNAGINTGGLLKGLISVAAPIILGSMISRGLGRGRSRMSGGGGLPGGGLGSLIGMLSGGRGMGGIGGLLGRTLGG